MYKIKQNEIKVWFGGLNLRQPTRNKYVHGQVASAICGAHG